jgi:hypothetical protein
MLELCLSSYLNLQETFFHLFTALARIDLNNTKVSNIHGIEKQSAQDLLTKR